MLSQEAKCLRVSDILHVEIAPETVAEVIDVSLATVYNIRTAMKMSDGVARKTGSGGGNKKGNEAFLEDVKDRVKEDLTVFMRRLSVEFNISQSTISRAIHEDFGP